jgi:hypothetical protein
MNFSAPLAGYFLMVFIIMFGGAKETHVYRRQPSRSGHDDSATLCRCDYVLLEPNYLAINECRKLTAPA